MTNDNAFFDEVFDDPEEDPLLPNAGESSSEEASDSNEEGPPSWIEEEPDSEHTHFSRKEQEDGSESGRERKEVIVDQRKNDPRGLSELNQAVGQGWRLVRIVLAQQDGQQDAMYKEAQRFIAILEQDTPQSLFDFG